MYESLRVPLMPEGPKQIRLISPDFPWAFDIGPSAGEEVVTCFDVLAILHYALQCRLTETEWGTAGNDKCQYPLHVDWLGSSIAFMGLVKDEASVRFILTGGGERPETWVVKFQKL
ncbi:hypothetical protein BDR07DRAFT_1375326 [Suillus spraguei]|nr:hypothetical protein BDR07DRAFT_1375326 [Suillus spraguei]